MSNVRVIVMDEPGGSFESALIHAYCEHLRIVEVVPGAVALEVHFISDEGLWVGGGVASEDRKRLASDLLKVRQAAISSWLLPHATALDLSSDPFASDFFDREPDAWLVSGGGEPTLRVESRDAMNAEMERRKSKLSKSI